MKADQLCTSNLMLRGVAFMWPPHKSKYPQHDDVYNWNKPKERQCSMEPSLLYDAPCRDDKYNDPEKRYEY